MERVGFGYDIHPLVEGRRLYLGGVEIDYPMGLLGNSDADVVIHSLCDAFLGALALGDLGDYFPPDDPAFKDIRSELLLKEVLKLLEEKGYIPYQIDVTVVAQAPRLKSYIPAMRENLSKILHLSLDKVSVKAVSPEGLGALGRGEGIAALSLVKVVEKNA